MKSCEMSSENLKNTIIGHLRKEYHFGTSQMRFSILLRVSIITFFFFVAAFTKSEGSMHDANWL